MLPTKFKPKGTFNLIRLGKDNDGGYLVEKNSINGSKSLIAMGIGKDWSFEKDFYSLNPKKINAYDHTVTIFFWIKFFIKKILRVLLGQFSAPYQGMLTFLDYKNFFTGDVVFFKEKVGSGKQSTISVNQAIERLDKNDMPVFFKIDIEGSEYVILDQLISNNENIIGLVIEFHYVGKNQNKIEKFIDLFPLELVHIHPNNNRKTDDKGDPNTLEMTFAKSPKMLSDKLVLPNELDQKNAPLKDEINLNFSS